MSEVNPLILEDRTQIRPHVVSRAVMRANFFRLAMLGLLLLACYLPMLIATGRIIIADEDMAYGFFAPPVALYLVWRQRSLLLEPTSTPSYWSVPLLAFGALVATLAALANSSTFSRFGFLFSVVGCLLLIGGWRALRVLLFPLSLLLFTFPIPSALYGELTQPLQLLASRLSESALEMLGLSVLREGNVLHLTFMSLSVVEACSGLRSLVTLTFFCLVYAYFFETVNWVRAAVVILAVPSAILVNALRITSTGVLGKYNMAWTEGLYHEIVGWLAFTLGFLLVLLAHHILRRLSRQSHQQITP